MVFRSRHVKAENFATANLRYFQGNTDWYGSLDSSKTLRRVVEDGASRI